MNDKIDTKLAPIAKRYTNAMVEIAQENNTVDKTFGELKTAADVVASSATLTDFMSNPAISLDAKKDVVNTIFKKELSETTYNLIYVLLDQNRFNLLEPIYHTYEQTLNELNDIATVTVTSAIELNDGLKTKLQKKLEDKFKKKIIIGYSVDTSIIAGLVVQLGDDVIDASYASKFETMRKQLI